MFFDILSQFGNSDVDDFELFEDHTFSTNNTALSAMFDEVLVMGCCVVSYWPTAS